MSKSAPPTLELDLDRWMKRGREKARRKFIAICLEAHQQLVRLSPVDTGFFRSQWNVSINDPPPARYVERPEEGGTPAVPDLGSITAAGLGDRVWLYNPTRYAMALENGHSQQAPNGMVKLVTLHLQAKYGRKA